MSMKHGSFIGLAAAAIIIIGASTLLQSSSAATSWLWNISAGGTLLFPLVSVSALIDSVNPCAFSILLVTIAFLLSLGALRSKILTVGGFYIGGIFTAYLLIGLGLLQALHLFNTPHFMGTLGAVLLIVLGGISLINEFFPSFPVKLKIPRVAHGRMAELMEKSSLPAAFLLGGLVGLCEFPCTGGPYLMVIGLLHDQQTYLRGLVYLFWYNLLFVVPLVLVLMLASNRSTHEKMQTWKKKNLRAVRVVSGIVMVALGVLILA